MSKWKQALLEEGSDERHHFCNMVHTCHRCGRATWCGTYKWACPWLNGDEDQMCQDCLGEVAGEMYDAEAFDDFEPYDIIVQEVQVDENPRETGPDF